MSDDYLFDRSGPPDPDVERLEKLLAPLAHDAPLDELRMRRRRRLSWFVLGIAVAAAAAVAIYIALPTSHANTCTGTGFEFSAIGGDVTCGGAHVAKGVLPVGGQLDTGAHEASLKIADIGTAKLGTNTRVRLDRTDPKRHQLTLDRGHLHARVVAVPRLFAVATKHTNIVDLGCEYTVDVDASGVGRICVQSGRVELATKSGAVVVAPLGTCAAILAGQRPGLPLGDGANTAMQNAVRAYDRGEVGALDTLLAAAETRDAITLIALAAIDANPTRVLARLMELSPPPDAEITVDTALSDPEKLAAWRTDIIEIWAGLYRPGAKRP